MKNFLLQFSASWLREASYREQSLSLLADVLPALMAYAMYASPDGEKVLADGARNDEYYRKVSGLGVAKWKAAKAWLKKAGWLDYIPVKGEGGRYEKWRVVIKAPGLNFWTQYDQAEATVEETTGTEIHWVENRTNGEETTGTVFHPVENRPHYNDKDDLDNDKDNLEGPGLEKPGRLDLEVNPGLEDRIDKNPGIENRLDTGRTFTHPVEGWACENRDDVIKLYEYNYNMITTGKNRKVLAAKVQEYSGSREEFIQSYLDWVYTSDFKLHPKTNLEKSLEIHLGYQLRGQTHARAVQEDTAKLMAKNTVANCEQLWGEDYTHNGAGTRVIDEVRHEEIAAVTKLIRRRLLTKDRIYRLLICQKVFPQEWFRHWKDFDSPNGLMVKEFEEMYMAFQEWEEGVIRNTNPKKSAHLLIQRKYKEHGLI